MALWEYKVITSGPHGFASPALLEAHLNALGKDEWEIIHFQTLPNNSLAFHGLARRSTTRDWVPPIETVVAAPPKPAAERIATKPANGLTKPEPETLVSRMEEKAEGAEPVREETLRPMRNTEHDLDPDAEEEEDWDNWEEDEDDLPTFFEAMKPHLRRNQKGPGMSVAVDYLAKRWEQRENDLIGALKECGFTIPETEESDPEYFEFEGDLYWVNRNNRGQLFINTREKPRPVFRTAQAKKLDPNDPAAAELASERAAERAELEKRKHERAERQAAQAAAAAAKESGPAVADQPDAPGAEPAEASNEPAGPLPTGPELLDKIRPMMRRNRRGPGYSGSIAYLARGFKHSEAELTAALAGLGLVAPASPNDKAVNVEIGQGIYWMNKDSRGGIWINGREKREGGRKPEEKAEGNAPENPEAGATSTREAATATERPSESVPQGTVPTMTQPEPAVEAAPAREVTPQTAKSSGAPEDKTEDAAATDESSGTESAAGSEGETPKRGKARAPRRTGGRTRTRKAKTDTTETDAGSSEEPVVPETDSAKGENESNA